jgi:L-asparaginase II
MSGPAVLAHVVRSGFVESVHHGHAVVVDPSGAVVVSLGDPGAPVFPRSSLKPLFAVGMLRAGLDLTAAADRHLLALAAASHSGEGYHLDGVRRLLARAGLTEAALRNAADLPLDPVERARWQTFERPATALAHNCSGKHAALLATCVANGWDTASYLDPGHPVADVLDGAVADLTGEEPSAVGTDGCGTPVHAVSLSGLARAFGRVAAARVGPEADVADAYRRHPEWVAGTGRYALEMARAVPGAVVKDGAEAVCAVGLPDGSAVAVKVLDGAERALRPVLAALLRPLGAGSPALDAFARVPVLGGGERVGDVEVPAAG